MTLVAINDNGKVLAEEKLTNSSMNLAGFMSHTPVTAGWCGAPGTQQGNIATEVKTKMATANLRIVFN